jgi:hypothetical protein
VSRFSEKRLAADLVAAIRGPDTRRRRDLLLVAITFLGGLVGNFLFSKVEIAVSLWAVTLWAIADFIFSFRRTHLAARVVGEAALILLGLWITAPFISVTYRSQHAALLKGVLHSPDDGKDHRGKPIHIQVGQGTTSLLWNGPDGGPQFANYRNEFKVWRDQRGWLQISTTIRDENDNLVGSIDSNVWQVSASQSECWDKNYTDNALEIKDGQGRVLLQVVLFPDKIQLQAQWHSKKGRDLTLTMDGYTDQWGIVPMFKYPSGDHWGEFSQL